MSSPIKTHVFPNGFRIVYEKSNSPLPISSIYAFCHLGSIHEKDTLHGASHIIEHMCFKGTPRIPTTKDVFLQYDKIGAYFNAFTSNEYTCYTIKCNSEYFQHSLSIVSDMMLNSVFRKNDYQREHPVVIEENNNNDNNPDRLIGTDTAHLLYLGSLFEHAIDKLAYHVPGNLNYKDVLETYHRYYRRNNMLVSIVSDIPFETIKGYLNKTLFIKGGGNSKNECVPDLVRLPLTPQSGCRYNLRNKKGLTNTLVTIGFRTCARNSPDMYPLEVLKIILGESSGRLFGILRVKKSIVYSPKVETDYNTDTGSFIFLAKTDSHKLMHYKKDKGLLPLFIEIITNLIRKGVDEDELNMAKGFIRGNILLSLQDQGAQVIYNGEACLLNNASQKIVPYSELYETYYKNIKKKDIIDVIHKYFIQDNMTVCLVGETLPSLDTIEKTCNKI